MVLRWIIVFVMKHEEVNVVVMHLQKDVIDQ